MVRLEDILEKVSSYNGSGNLDIIKKAYVFSGMVHEGQKRMSGAPYLSHPLEVAYILSGMEMDPITVATGLLHDTVEDTHTTIDKIRELFGGDIASLVDGLTKLSQITFNNKADREAENFRKMLVAMANDIRVLVIKLADRLHNMRTIEALPDEKQMKIAGETLDIYAPLAHRLGLGKMKVELEELSFRILKPEEYRKLKEQIESEDEEMGQYINDVKAILEKRLSDYNINGVVTGRLKHFYSIYRKIVEDNLDLEHVYDVVAFRIIVDSLKECYEALGIVHSMWKPIPGRFKDYIAIPKQNMYQSIHTTMIDPHGNRMEVQIRTHEMHRIAECGIAAHWKYKEGKDLSEKDERRFAWLRQLLETQKELKDSEEFMKTLKVDLFPEEVFVFTPDGDIKEFPTGATAIDFAYSIHTDIGNRCVGARVNRKMVPLKYRLNSGDTVEILTSQNQHPNKDWLNYVVTSRARARIRQWIRTEEREKSIALGRMVCEKEFKRYDLDLNRLLKTNTLENIGREFFGLNNVEGLFAKIGYGKLSILQIVSKILPPGRLPQSRNVWISRFKKIFQRSKKEFQEGVIVDGIDDVMIKFAKCCNPLPGDRIVGFITVGSGISIHTNSCLNVIGVDQERIIGAEWASTLQSARPARIEITCVNEKGLLSEISTAISSAGANISNADVRTEDKKAICTFEMEVQDLNHLRTIINGINSIKKVVKVERILG